MAALDLSGAFEKAVDMLAEKHPDVPRAKISKMLEERLEENPIEVDLSDEPPPTPSERLQINKKTGMWGVQLMSMRSPSTCEVCSNADGDIYPIDYAIEVQPLPHKDCSCEMGCGCCYMPVLDDPRT